MIQIQPATPGVAPGGQIQFTATVSPTYGPDVVWSCQAGTITPEGLWTAPATPGLYWVRAESTPNLGESGQVTVCVGTGYLTRIQWQITDPGNIGFTGAWWEAGAGPWDGNPGTSLPASGDQVFDGEVYWRFTSPAITDPTAAIKTTSIGFSARSPLGFFFSGIPGHPLLVRLDGEYLYATAPLYGYSSWASNVFDGNPHTLIVEQRGATLTATITPYELPAPVVTVTQDAEVVEVGGKVQLSASVAGPYQQGVLWTASSGTITSEGLFTATAPGEVTITATYPGVNGPASATATVIVAAVAPSFLAVWSVQDPGGVGYSAGRADNFPSGQSPEPAYSDLPDAGSVTITWPKANGEARSTRIRLGGDGTLESGRAAAYLTLSTDEQGRRYAYLGFGFASGFPLVVTSNTGLAYNGTPETDGGSSVSLADTGAPAGAPATFTGTRYMQVGCQGATLRLDVDFGASGDTGDGDPATVEFNLMVKRIGSVD
jgi:hypothetical protein